MVQGMDDSAAIVHAAPAEPSEIRDLASSFEMFVDAESVRFHAALRLLTRDRAEAEDLMQDAFLKVWERWEHARSLDDPTGYLYRTAMNLYRKRRRRAAVVDPSSSGNEVAPRLKDDAEHEEDYTEHLDSEVLSGKPSSELF